MRNISRVAVLSLLVFVASAFLNVGASYGADVMDCISSDLDSCDFNGLKTLCDQLYSNPQPCDKLCKSAFSGETVGTCVICCKNLKAQLGLGQIRELELEE